MHCQSVGNTQQKQEVQNHFCKKYTTYISRRRAECYKILKETASQHASSHRVQVDRREEGCGVRDGLSETLLIWQTT